MEILKRIQYIIKATINTFLEDKINRVKKKRRPVHEYTDDSFFNHHYQETTNQKQHTTRRVDPNLVGHYAALEIPYGSDLETVTSAWKRLLKKYHPDLYSNDPGKIEIAQKITQGLNEAYATIQKALKENRVYL